MKVFECSFSEQEIESLKPVIKNGELGFGSNVTKFEEKFAALSKKKYNIATNSASASAFAIFHYLKEVYGPCDVYTPSLGFTSPAWAAKHHGHRIVWVDVDDNLLFDLEDYRRKRQNCCERYSDAGVKPVLMPILYGGVSNIKGFDSIKLDGYREIVVVDSAHCVTPTIDSDFTFFSFHPYKPITASDGGMISVDCAEAADWFNNYRNFGRCNNLGTYDIIQEGFKFYMNNLNASIALLSLSKHDELLQIRKNNYNKLNNVLPQDDFSSYYFATRLDDNANQFNTKNGLARHYPLLHHSKYFKDGCVLPNTERLYNKIINLPLWQLL
tara:strand:- start:1452 stop:2432 length:981 start_codon:yes stop_codon:yes gene_type:complete